jgi:hypothetical protein
MPNAYLKCRLGLGDQLANHFHRRTSAKNIARLWNGKMSGRFDRIAVIPPKETDDGFDGWNPAALEIYAALGIQTRDENGIDGWTDVTTLEGDDQPRLQVPTVPPPFAIPARYILFSQHAGRPDRCLDHPELYQRIKDAVRLPVVKVGCPWREGTDIAPIESDLNLSGRTTVPQTAWLAKHAVAVVAPISFHRCWTWAFGVPCIEIAQHGRILQEMVDKTNREYAERSYGTNDLNFWLTIPQQWHDLERCLKLCVERETKGIVTLWT